MLYFTISMQVPSSYFKYKILKISVQNQQRHCSMIILMYICAKSIAVKLQTQPTTLCKWCKYGINYVRNMFQFQLSILRFPCKWIMVAAKLIILFNKTNTHTHHKPLHIKTYLYPPRELNSFIFNWQLFVASLDHSSKHNSHQFIRHCLMWISFLI